MKILISFLLLVLVIFSLSFFIAAESETVKNYTIEEYDSPKKHEITQSMKEDLSPVEYLLFQEGYNRLKLFNVLDTVQNKSIGETIQLQKKYNRRKYDLKKPYSVAVDAIWSNYDYSSTTRFTRLLCEKSDSISFNFNEDSTKLDFKIQYSFLDSNGKRNKEIANMIMEKENKTWNIITIR